jgi:hypothetical protein
MSAIMVRNLLGTVIASLLDEFGACASHVGSDGTRGGLSPRTGGSLEGNASTVAGRL